jgi:tetratricopeptide (TPR) repeat protein
LFLKVNPKHAECYFNLGQVLETLGEQEEALKAYGNATEFRPNYSKAYLLKIAILKKVKRGNDILMTCKVALKNEPTDFEILYEEGLSLFGMQRFK